MTATATYTKKLTVPNPIRWSAPSGLYWGESKVNAMRGTASEAGQYWANIAVDHSRNGLTRGLANGAGVAANMLGGNAPDYVTLDTSWISLNGAGVGGNCTVTSTRHLYCGGGASIGIPGIAAAIRVGQTDASCVDDYVNGPTATVAGSPLLGLGPAAAIGGNAAGTGTEVGLGLGLDAGETWGVNHRIA